MKILRLAMQSIRRNSGSYLAYFFSNVIIVATIFVSIIFNNHPLLVKYLAEGGVPIDVSPSISQLTLFGPLLLLFLFSSVSFFLQTRKKEIALYTIHGATLWQIGLIIFVENILIGFAVTVSGIVLGLSLSKLYFILIAPFTNIPVTLPFYFSLEDILLTGATIGVLFLFSSLVSLFFIRSKKAISLLKGKSVTMKKTKLSIMLFLIGVIMIGIARYMFPFWWNEGSIFSSFGLFSLIITMLGMVVGSYLIIANLGVFFQQLFQKDSQSATSVLWKAQQRFQAKAYSIAGILATFFFFLAMYFTNSAVVVISNQFSSDYPFTYYLVAHQADKSKLTEYEGFLNNKLNQKKVTYKRTTFDSLVVRGIKGQYTRVVRYSDYRSIAAILGRAKPASLSNNEVLYLASETGVLKQQKNWDEIKALKIVGSPTAFSLHLDKGNLIPELDTIIVSDATYTKLAKIKTYPTATSRQPLATERYTVYFVPAWMESGPKLSTPENILNEKISYGFKEGLDFGNGYDLYDRFPSLLETDIDEGILGAIICFFAGASFLYFRNSAQMKEEQGKYHILSKLGWTVNELRQLSTMQMAYLFFVPFGLAAVETLLFNDEILIYLLSAIGIQLVILVIYFLFARIAYLRKVKLYVE